MAFVAPLLGALAAGSAVAGTAYNIVSTENAKKKAQENADQQKKAAGDLKAQQDQQLQDQQKAEQTAAADAANASLARNKKQGSALLGASNNRGSTILTSPLGDTTPAPTAGKTLLGQ